MLGPSGDDDAWVFLERTRVETRLGCCRGVLTLEPGSRFECAHAQAPGKIWVKGGEVIIREGKRLVDIRDDLALVRMQKAPGQIYPLRLLTQIPSEAGSGAEYRLTVSQRDSGGNTVGGASVVYRVR